jgi:lipopolysaccharide export system protein LptC
MVTALGDGQSGVGAALPRQASNRRWGPFAAADHYSRRVALLRRLLPVTGLSLLVMLAAWPRLGPLLESVRIGFPAIDLREARELKMVNPRYAGVDRFNRPYVVTAELGRQTTEREDVMALERPRAELTMHNGAIVVVTSATGVYQSQAQLLDLFDDVNLVRQDGTRFVTRRAHLNLNDDTAEGHEPVEGHGPSGDVAGQGFQILSKGQTIIIGGESELHFKGTKSTSSAKAPPALPAEIAETAVQIEAAAMAVAAPETLSRPEGTVAKPDHAKPAAKPRAAAKPPLANRHSPKARPNANPATVKMKGDVG